MVDMRFFIPKGFDGKEYISKPSDREVAAYGNVSRRDFLKYAAMTAAAYAAGCSKTPTGPDPIRPGLEPPIGTIDPSVNVQMFREMCLGIDAPYPNGGASINSDGRSYRLRDGINPKLFIVRNPQAVDANAKYEAFVNAQSAFSEFTKDKIHSEGHVFVDNEPENPPEGAIICLLDRESGIATQIYKSGFNIIKSRVRAATNLPFFSNLDKAVKHEYGHTIGLDHVSDPNALMNPNIINNVIVTEDEKNAAYEKYNKPAGFAL